MAYPSILHGGVRRKRSESPSPLKLISGPHFQPRNLTGGGLKYQIPGVALRSKGRREVDLRVSSREDRVKRRVNSARNSSSSLSVPVDAAGEEQRSYRNSAGKQRSGSSFVVFTAVFSKREWGPKEGREKREGGPRRSFDEVA
nr:hypothetical protein Iba_chr11aCG16900 [Ipomoea batatas]